MPLRAKFILTSITQHSWDKVGRSLIFEPVYDATIAADQKFSKTTPSGSFEMYCDNPIALEKLQLGQAYYFYMVPEKE